jgi:hypothetical protein
MIIVGNDLLSHHKHCFQHALAVWPLASHFTSLSTMFPLYFSTATCHAEFPRGSNLSEFNEKQFSMPAVNK